MEFCDYVKLIKGTELIQEGNRHHYIYFVIKGSVKSYYLNEGKHITPLEKNNVRDTMLEHLSDLYDFYGEQLGVRLARKHLNWYCMYLDNSKDFRAKAVRAISANEQIGLVKEYFQSLNQRN